MGSGDVEICTVAENKDQVNNYHDESEYTKRQRASWIWTVPMIVVANVVVFVIIMFVNNCPKHNDGECVAKFLGRLSFEPRRENPLLGPSSSTLHNALEWNKTVLPNQCWRIIARMWFHSNLFQLLINMLSLMIFGTILERQFRSVRVGLIYVLSGICGSILSSLFNHNSTSVGASGAVFGLIGAMLSELARLAVYYSNVRSAALFNLFMAIINLAFVGIYSHVDYYMHIGGWLSGFLLGFVLCNWPDPRSAGHNGDK